jgi:hypothetical protein
MSETNEKKSHEENPSVKEAREHMKAAREQMHKSYEKILPEGFIEHRRAARHEFLLAMRSMLDAAIERVEKHSEKK